VHAAQDTQDHTLKYAVKVVKIPADNACFVRRLIREVLQLQRAPHKKRSQLNNNNCMVN
jgi:hypothetical protein